MKLKKKVITTPLNSINNKDGVPVDIAMINKAKKILAGQSKDKKHF